MVKDSSRDFFLQLQISFWSLLNRHHHTTADASTPTLMQPTTQRRQHTHTNTTKLNHTQTHHPFPAQVQAHLIPSGTRLAQLCQNSCFLHDAKVARPTGKGPLALTASQSRVYRESQLDERSLSLSLRTETQRADWRQKKKEKRAERRERERRKRTKEQRKKEERSKGQHTPDTTMHNAHRPHCTHTPPHATHYTPHTRHSTHTRMLGHVHGGQPTVILRRKSECLDMCTAVDRP